MEESITLKEIFEVLRKRLLLIVLMIISAVSMSAILSYFVLTPTYEASTQFIVNQETGEQAGVDINQIRSNVEIINTYNDIIKSNRILDQVVKELDLTITPGALGKKINVSSSQNSQVVTLTASDFDPNLAVEIANTTVEVFREDLPNIMNVNNVSVLSEAFVPDNPIPVSPKPLLNIAIAVVLGAMIGVGIAFLLEYLDNSIKTEKDVEDKLGLPILGVIAHIDESEIIGGHTVPKVSSHLERSGLSGQEKKTV